MKKFIVALMCFVLFIFLGCLLYTNYKVAYNMIIDAFGGFYIGTLIGKFVDWLFDK